MKKINFRCWNEKNKQFAYFGTPQFDLRPLDNGSFEPFVSFANSDIPTAGGFSMSGWGETEQFTGLKDEKGREIFEGDILDITDGGLLMKSFVVDFRKQAFGVTHERSSVRFVTMINPKIKVVGNIHSGVSQ